MAFFFFNDTATTEIYTLSLHDALPILARRPLLPRKVSSPARRCPTGVPPWVEDRKSTRLNSSHSQISYAVFCLKKKIGVPELIAGEDEPCLSHGFQGTLVDLAVGGAAV